MTLDASQLTWDAPGAGQWEWEGSHFPGAPTPIQRALMTGPQERGIRNTFERYGMPMDSFAFRFVNGRVYARLMPLIGAEKNATKAPPTPVLWAMLRLHPTFRKRNKTAARALGGKQWRTELARWHDEQRDACIVRNEEINAVDPSTLDHATLVDHLRAAHANVETGYELHFVLHGTDLGPLGDLIAHCGRWGITANEAMSLLTGYSPASVAPTGPMADLAKLVADAPAPPKTLDDIRALGSAARDALDDFLHEYGWRITTGYDLEHRCLIELPDAVVRAITAAAAHIGRPPTEPDESLATSLRERVPADQRALFDDLVAEARTVYGLRDYNGPLTIEWPIGLLRRAMLEAGARLVERGALDDREHVVELELDELLALLTDGSGPSNSDIAARAAHRAEQASFEPPHTVGPAEPLPPLDAFPDALRRVTEIAIAATTELEAPPEREPMVGLGIGTEIYVGTARVGADAEDVLARMEPGDVLIAPFTNPAYNVVLSMAGAVVCQQGGPLSHAAVMAREFGFPAVVGALNALTEIKDGDTVEVDPLSGRVRVL